MRRRSVPLAVHQPVDAALKPAPKRLEHDGHKPRRRQRDGEVALSLEQGPQGYHHEHVDPDDAGGQGTVDESTVYDYVNVVEVKTEDGDVGAGRNSEQGQNGQVIAGKNKVPFVE
jgi:hypothetical protein